MNRKIVLIAAMMSTCSAYTICYGGDGVVVGQQVTQKRGFVCIDETFMVTAATQATPPQIHEKKADHCWFLNRIRAIGVVVKVESETAVVEFATDLGWERVAHEKFSVVGFYDFWGEPETFYYRPELDVTFEKPDCGLLLTGEENERLKLPIRVKMPKALLSWPLPRFGDKVTRGPDWNKGSADLEPGLQGRIIPGTPGQVEPRDSDGYVTVEWEATKRRGRYRWDLRRKFDVTPVAGTNLPVALPSASEGTTSTSAAPGGDATDVPGDPTSVSPAP